MNYRVTLVRDEAGLERLEESWTRLLETSQAASIFASFPWNLAWWRAYGADKRLYVLVAADDSGQVRGIAPLMLGNAGPKRSLQFIGHGLSDTGDFVLDAEHAEPVARAIFAYLEHCAREWDLLDMDEVPPYSPLAQWLRSRPHGHLHLIELVRTDAPFIALPATWEDYTRSLARKPRQHLESFSRRVVQESGITFRLVTAEEDVPAAVERFYQLHLARWNSKADGLNAEHLEAGFLRFLREVCTYSARHGLLRLAELYAGDAIISSWISFNVNGRWNGYMTGFDPAWSHVRPGKVLHGFVMRAAFAENARELDFGRGAEEYKFEMGATNRKNYRFVVASNAPRSALAFGLTTLRIKGRDMVKAARASHALMKERSATKPA